MILKRCIKITGKQLFLQSQVSRLPSLRTFHSSLPLFNQQSTTPISSELDMSTLGSIKRPRKSSTKFEKGMPIDFNGVLALP